MTPKTLTPAQVDEFLQQGVITIDTPLTHDEIAEAVAALDRLAPQYLPEEPDTPRYRPATGTPFEPAIINVIQHPFFEAVAKDILDTDTVYMFQSAGLIAYPQPDTPWSYDQHVDIQYRLSDFEATPRRIICSFFLWLSDVTPERAPMVFRPGSHRLIAAENERKSREESHAGEVRGATIEMLPALDYAPIVPLTARAGQVSVLTTSAVHGSSTNIDDSPRKLLIITFGAAGVEVGLPAAQLEGKLAYDRALRPLLRPERRHIIQDAA
jgi:hypothetical protein